MNHPGSAYTTERRDARENHERILSAALEIFSKRGLEAAMKDVAARAGVGVGTLYRHFKNRETLLAALIDHVHAEVGHRMEVAAREPTALGALRAIIRIALDQIGRFGALTEIVMSDDQLRSEEKRRRIQRGFDEIIARGIESGEFRRDLDGEMMRATIEALWLSGKMHQLARTRGSAEAADRVVSFLAPACLTPGRPP